MYKIALLGNWGTALEILKLLSNSKFIEIKFIITQNDKKKDCNKWFNIVWNYAKSKGLCTYEQKKFKKNSAEILKLAKQNNLDLIISCAYPYLLKDNIIEFMNSKLGIVNLHGSLLPLYRGVSPVLWAIINEEKYIGMTLHYIDRGCDSGNIIFQDKIENKYEDSIDIITEKLKYKAIQLFKKFLNLLENNDNIDSYPQDHSKATNAFRIKDNDLRINFSQNCNKIMAFFKATSHLGPYFYYNSNRYNIIKLFPTTVRSEYKTSTIVDIIFLKKQIIVSANDFNIKIQVDSINNLKQFGLLNE